MGRRALLLRTPCPDLLHRGHRRPELGQPLLGVAAHQADGPDQRLGPGAGDPGVHERVENQPLGLPEPADRDAVTYWRAWQPPGPGDDEALRRTRAVASTAVAFADLVQSYAEVTAAVLVAAGRAPAGEPVRTQGWVMEVDDLLSTLAVEAAVHHLDLVAHLDRPGPAAEPLAEVRRVLAALCDGPLPAGWDDVTAARRGTGREPLTDADRAELGAAAAAFPLFG